MMEVHDCFSITELVTMEDLFVSKDGRAVNDVLDGFYAKRGGGAPCLKFEAISVLGLH